MSSFIPSFHFDSPSSKLTPEWCQKVIDYLYFNKTRRGLLHGKKISEIEEYAAGNFDMKPYRRLYNSIKKSYIANNPKIDFSEEQGESIDEKMQFEPLPLIPAKLNAAIAVIQKVPVEVSVTALDPLAARKREEDVNFLKNKPAIEEDLQPIADQLQQQKIDLGATKHSYIPYSQSPYGLDLMDDEEAEIFANIIYNLGVEVSLETVLQIFYEIKKGVLVKGLEIQDQFKFGVSVNSTYISEVTGLPELEYEHPQFIETPPSRLQDFSDNTHRFKEMTITPLELFNYFPKEICDENALNTIMNEKVNGYCACNNHSPVGASDFGSFKITLIKVEVRSVDSVGVVAKSKGRQFSYFTDSNDDKCTSRIWGQNTYVFYWLKGTKYFFNIHKLDYAYRSIGNETIQNFTTNIFKSQQVSAVELSIKENKRAQIADIKMQYEILMSLPSGKYIDLKYLRSAVAGLTDESDDEDGGEGGSSKYTIEYLIDLFMERNQMIGDSEGFDGPNESQFKPFMDIVGGLKLDAIAGYVNVIAGAKKNISDFTGINDQLVGSSANPEGLIGLQKLLINSSINSIYYISEAINYQQQAIFNTWGFGIQSSIKAGGKSKQAIINMIGDRKVNIIERLDEIPIHNLGIKVTTNQREEERAKFEERKNRLKQIGAISVADEFILDAIQNPKDKIALLAARESQFNKKQDKIRAEQAQQQQAMIQAQGQNMVNVKQAEGENKIKQIYAKGETDASLQQLIDQSGMNQAQFDAMVRKMLQDQRATAQVDKGVRLIEAKENIKDQQPA